MLRRLLRRIARQTGNRRLLRQIRSMIRRARILRRREKKAKEK